MIAPMSYPMFNFDTLKFAKKLEKVGIAPSLAEIQAEAFGEQAQAINNIIDKQLATKDDLEKLRIATKEDIEKLRLATKGDIDKLRIDIDKLRIETKGNLETQRYKITYELTTRIGSMFVAAVVILGIAIPIISKFLNH